MRSFGSNIMDVGSCFTDFESFELVRHRDFLFELIYFGVICVCVCVCVPDELDMILCGVAIKPICLSCHAAILWLRGGGAF